MTDKFMILVTDATLTPRVIGPFDSYEAADQMSDEVEDAGWTRLGLGRLISPAACRKELKEN